MEILQSMLTSYHAFAKSHLPIHVTFSTPTADHTEPGATLIKSTYSQIQAFVKETAGFVPKKDWIARVKELNGLRLRRTRHEPRTPRLEPCPPGKRKAIEEALRQFGLLSQRT